MEIDYDVSDMEVSYLENEKYEIQFQQKLKELAKMIEEENIEVAANLPIDLSKDSSQQVLYNVLKHYVRKNRYEKIIRFIAENVHRSLDVSVVIDNAVDAMNKYIKAAENVSIYIVEGDYAVLKSYRGYEGNDLIKSLNRIPKPKGFTWQTINSGEPTYCQNVDDDPYIGLKGKELGTKSYVSMPIHFRGKAIGCININSTNKYSFDSEELNLLEVVSSQIETAINNAKQAEAISNSEDALKQAQNDLEQRVRERTLELEKSNILLIKEILERRCAESELKQSLAEKNVLLQEIHHRVKNNLQIISSLLNLQSRKLSDQTARHSFDESNNRIRSMATLHEQLYRSKDLSRINFTDYISNMTNNLLRSYGVSDNRINIIINKEEIFLGINTAIPCGLIVNELVSNAIKHGFPDKCSGEIRININNIDNKYLLTVSNDGVPFPADLDIYNSTTLGLELVSSLSKQLKGELSLSTDNTTEFRLEFKA